MKIAMIGASGFVGTRLIDLLKADSDKYNIKNIDLQPSHFFNDLTVIGDVRNQEQMDKELAGCDLVILLAAQHRDDVTPISLYYDTNVGGMEKTLQAMEKNGVNGLVTITSDYKIAELNDELQKYYKMKMDSERTNKDHTQMKQYLTLENELLQVLTMDITLKMKYLKLTRVTKKIQEVVTGKEEINQAQIAFKAYCYFGQKIKRN